MADVIGELLVSEAAIEKLGARGISVDEAQQIPRNTNVTVRNPHERRDSKRRLLIGRTDAGRPLTFVIEATVDPSTWVTSHSVVWDVTNWRQPWPLCRVLRIPTVSTEASGQCAVHARNPLVVPRQVRRFSWIYRTAEVAGSANS